MLDPSTEFIPPLAGLGMTREGRNTALTLDSGSGAGMMMGGNKDKYRELRGILD